jgi:hypothetical protein
MKRTIAPPGAIVRRSALNKATDTEEANDRTSLGDRSLTRQAPVDEPSPPHAHTTALRANDRPALCDRSHTGYPSSRDLFRSRLPQPLIFPAFTNPAITPPTFGETPNHHQSSQIPTNHHQIITHGTHRPHTSISGHHIHSPHPIFHFSILP